MSPHTSQLCAGAGEVSVTGTSSVVGAGLDSCVLGPVMASGESCGPRVVRLGLWGEAVPSLMSRFSSVGMASGEQVGWYPGVDGSQGVEGGWAGK